MPRYAKSMFQMRQEDSHVCMPMSLLLFYWRVDGATRHAAPLRVMPLRAHIGIEQVEEALRLRCRCRAITFSLVFRRCVYGEATLIFLAFRYATQMISRLITRRYATAVCCLMHIRYAREAR